MAEQCRGRGVKGVVAAAAPLAAALGAQAMRDGGNAFDGAVTAALAETVLLPSKCGLAGDLVALCVTREHPTPQALLAIGGAARGLDGAISERGQLPLVGGLSVGIPGAPAGYAALAQKGRIPLAELVRPAKRLAESGIVWSPICGILTQESADLVRRESPYPTSFYPEGRPLEAGSIVRFPGLHRTLEEFANRGAALFTGALGQLVVEIVASRGGVIEQEDFSNPSAEWVPAKAGNMGEFTVWATPAPTHGEALLASVGSLSNAHGAKEVWGLIRAAMDARDSHLSDLGMSSTSMVSASDSEGNVVVIIHSNSFPHFGSGLIVSELDLVLNNRAGRGFSSQPGHPNFPAPGKRPATTLHAWAVGKSGIPAILGGTPGGVNQLPWNTQLLADIAAGCSDPGLLVTAPRWEWVPENSASVEADLPAKEVEELRSCFGAVEIKPRWGLRSAQQIIEVPTGDGPCVAAVDPRTGGSVVSAD